MSIALFILYIHNNKNEDIIFDEKELLIIEELKLKSVDSIDIHSSDIVGNVEMFQFEFSKDYEQYIGFVAFFHENVDGKNYAKENIITSDYNIMGTVNSFDLYTVHFNVPSRLLIESNQSLEYQYYYGNINDKHISEIVFEYPNEYIHIKPVSDKFYTIGMISRDDLISIKGINHELEILYEYLQ